MPDEKTLFSKFLTREIAENAMIMAMDAADATRLCGKNLHIVMLGPRMKSTPEGYPNYLIEPYIVAERSFGDKKDWAYDFADIAQCKALQLWHSRADGGTDILPHLLFPGDAPLWGGVKRSGIVVACSGFRPWFDRMVAGIVADICIARAYDAWMNSPEKADDDCCFLK